MRADILNFPDCPAGRVPRVVPDQHNRSHEGQGKREIFRIDDFPGSKNVDLDRPDCADQVKRKSEIQQEKRFPFTRLTLLGEVGNPDSGAFRSPSDKLRLHDSSFTLPFPAEIDDWEAYCIDPGGVRRSV